MTWKTVILLLNRNQSDTHNNDIGNETFSKWHGQQRYYFSVS